VTGETPRRPVALVVALAFVSVLAMAVFVLQASVSHTDTDAQGIARQVPLAERVLRDPGTFVIPLAFAVAAATGALGLWSRREWGRYAGVSVGAGVVAVGAFLLYQAAREWGMAGSFSALLVPPAIVCLAVGLYLSIAAARSHQRLA
jgi:hypothetical protein